MSNNDGEDGLPGNLNDDDIPDWVEYYVVTRGRRIGIYETW